MEVLIHMKDEIIYEDVPMLTDADLLASGLNEESIEELSNNKGNPEEVEVEE